MIIHKSPKGILNIYRQIMEIENVGTVVFYWATEADFTKQAYRFLMYHYYTKDVKDGKVEIIGKTNIQFFYWDKDFTTPDGRVMKGGQVEFYN